MPDLVSPVVLIVGFKTMGVVVNRDRYDIWRKDNLYMANNYKVLIFSENYIYRECSTSDPI